MAKHTPGPWYPTAHGFGRYSVVCAHAYDIATIDDRGNGAEVNAANARLIASAPAMLETLRGILARASSAPNDDPELAELELGRIMRAARDAISLAECRS